MRPLIPSICLVFMAYNCQLLAQGRHLISVIFIVINFGVLITWILMEFQAKQLLPFRTVMISMCLLNNTELIVMGKNCSTVMYGVLCVTISLLMNESSFLLSQQGFKHYVVLLTHLLYFTVRIGLYYNSSEILYLTIILGISHMNPNKKPQPILMYHKDSTCELKPKKLNHFETSKTNQTIKRQFSVLPPENKGMNLYLNIVEEFPEGVAIFKIGEDANLEQVFGNNSLNSILGEPKAEKILDQLNQLKNLQKHKNTVKPTLADQSQRIDVNLFKKLQRRSQDGDPPSHQHDFSQSSEVMNSQTIIDLEIKKIINQLFQIPIQEFLMKSAQVFHLFSVITGQKEEKSFEIKFFAGYCQDSPHILTVISDISFRDTILELEAQNQAKSNQLSYVSHEFRTPLNCIITMLEILLDEQKDSQYLNIALENSKYLLSMSNDFLDLALIKVGKFKLNRERFNLKNLLKECVLMFEVMSLQKKLKLNLNITEKVPSSIYQDRTRIKQILINLISNSFKYTLQGQINIMIDQTSNGIVVQVQDTGTGIRKEDQIKLMRAFGKGDNIEDQKYNKNGVGLGLLVSNMISKQLNNEQKGLQLESTYGQGTQIKFYISVSEDEDPEEMDINKRFRTLKSSLSHKNGTLENYPLLSVREQNELLLTEFTSGFVVPIESSPNTVRNIKKSCRCPFILIVDDNQFNIDALILRLNRIGEYRIDYAINGFQAIEKVKLRLKRKCCQYYKLIFMDLSMPQLNGFDTFRRLKQIVPMDELIVVACSGYTDKHEKMEAEGLGMIDYLEKPINASRLKQVVDSTL